MDGESVRDDKGGYRETGADEDLLQGKSSFQKSKLRMAWGGGKPLGLASKRGKHISLKRGALGARREVETEVTLWGNNYTEKRRKFTRPSGGGGQDLLLF